MAASQTLRAALSKVESSHPGFSYELVLGLVRKGDVTINMNESLLRLQGSTSEQDSKFKSYLHSFIVHLKVLVFFKKFLHLGPNWVH